GDFGLDTAAVGQAAAQPFDQPGAERVEFGNPGHINEDVGTASSEFLGVADDLFKRGRKAGGPRTCGTQGKAVAPCNPLQCRAAVHDANSCAHAPPLTERKSNTPLCCGIYDPNQP